MNPLQTDPCRACLPSACFCGPEGDDLIGCEDCLILFPEDEITICGACQMPLCDHCRDLSGICCHYVDED